jgi:hypothetical protein
MADERNDKKSRAEDQSKEQITGGQQSHRSEYGSQANQTDGSGGQPLGGNDGATGSGTPLTGGFGGAGEPSRTTGSGVGTPGGAAPPRSMGTRGDEFGQMSDYDRSGQQGQSGTGQADLGSQADTTLAGRTDQQDLGTDQPGSVGGASGGGSMGEGFIGSQDTGSDDLIEDREGAIGASSAKATGGSDFATQGRGALDEEEEEDESGAGPRDVGSGGPGSSV